MDGFSEATTLGSGRTARQARLTSRQPRLPYGHRRTVHLDRGYAGLEKKLQGVGARISRVSGGSV